MERPTLEQYFKLYIRQELPDPHDRRNFLVTLKNRSHPSFMFYPWLNDLLNELKSEHDGFAVLPAPVNRPWWAVLEVSPSATRDAIGTLDRTDGQTGCGASRCYYETKLTRRKSMADETVTAPTTLFDISKLSLEGLTMLYIFVPSYVGKEDRNPCVDSELITIARKELERRGALMLAGGIHELWYLPEDVKEELKDVFAVNHMLELFNDVTEPDPDGDEDEDDSGAS